jgi:hypothetical protein
VGRDCVVLDSFGQCLAVDGKSDRFAFSAGLIAYGRITLHPPWGNGLFSGLLVPVAIRELFQTRDRCSNVGAHGKVGGSHNPYFLEIVCMFSFHWPQSPRPPAR